MATTPLRKLNVLVVDDDTTIVKLVVKVLEKNLSELVKIHSTSDPLEARAWLEAHCCDILISDIEMPGIDGMEMLKFAKHRNAWTEVVFLTAHSTWDRIAEAIENGASDYLLKPLAADELVQVLSQEVARVTRWQNAVRGTLRATLAV